MDTFRSKSDSLDASSLLSWTKSGVCNDQSSRGDHKRYCSEQIRWERRGREDDKTSKVIQHVDAV